MSITIKEKGIMKNILILDGYAPGVRKEVSNVAKKHTDRIYDKSQQLVPVLSGALKRSGASIQTATGAKVVYNVDGSAPYAARIEYDASLHHKQGQAFFVGQPFQEEKILIRADIEKAAVAPLKKK